MPEPVHLDADDRDDVQVLGTAVVGAVHDGAHRQTEGHAEFLQNLCARFSQLVSTVGATLQLSVT